MKKLVLISALLALMVTPALAVPSLGYWQEGAPGTTHEVWDFTPASQNPGNPIQFYPEDEFNPNDGGKQVFLQTLAGTWDGTSALVGNTIIVDLKINDYLNYNNNKTVWVDLGLTNGSAVATIAATDHGVNFAVTQLDPSDSTGGTADFGWLIVPNPEFEDILITIQANPGQIAALDWVHVDTICVPAPGAILLGSMGIGLVGWLRRRRTL